MTLEVLSSEALTDGVLAREQPMLSQAIALTESGLAVHQAQAQDVMQRLLPRTGKAMRIGISGVPGVGKSTFMQTLGLRLIEQGHRVAVLAIDPGNPRSGIVIRTDKTQMPQLSLRDEAYVHTSLGGGLRGGVMRVSCESVLLCEAAGFDVILVETVGVEQYETMVLEMVDCRLVLVLPGATADLQGINKGVLELADIVAVNKADGRKLIDARQARATYQRAMSLMEPASSWKPIALTCSAVTSEGLDELWNAVRAHRRQLIDTGELVERRKQQRVRWVESRVS